MSGRVRLGLAFAALATAAGVGTISIRTTRAQWVALQACDALADGDSARTLALTEDVSPAGEAGRAATECRCRAQLAKGDRDGCAARLAVLAADPDWVPPPDLLPLAIDARARVAPEVEVLEALARRLPARGDAAARDRAIIAQRYLRRDDPPGALRVLGERPSLARGEALDVWFDTRLTAQALGDDLGAVKRTRADWLAAGVDPAIVSARYALALSIAGLADPEHDIIDLLEHSLDATAGKGDRKLREKLAIRLVLTLANSGRLDDALARFDRYEPELGLEGLHRSELLRAARRERLAHATPEQRRGMLRFQVADAPAGAELWLSPDEQEPADTPFVHRALPEGGELAVARSEGEAPQRWVLWGRRGMVASGTVNPRAGEERLVSIDGSGAARIGPAHVRSRKVGDGHRRVALVVLDCADWRLVRYLEARGELPVLTSLLRDGHHAVLDSDPPYTSAALESLVSPERHSGASVLGLVNRLGVELAGLSSVGDNPFDALRFVLPEQADLFSTIGAGDASAANLLLSHGGIRAGRNGDVSGPYGAHHRVPIGRAARDLDPDERERFPDLASADDERDRLYVRTIAAEFDATVALVRAHTHDLVAVRIEPLDILTHAHFAEAVADGQDNGRGLLYSVYRYIDARLAAVDAALDEDDVLIVMSDHGIRTAMEHSRNAIFVAVGGGVTPGRSPGRPDLRGVPRVIADLLGVATDWPETGVAAGALPALAAAERPPGSPAGAQSVR